MLFQFLVCILISFSQSILAASAASLKPPVAQSMNGLTMKDLEGFEKKWKLITVRHRKDTGELRFTYANTLAYKTLQAGKIDYPKGAMFAKVAFKTEEDVLFSSSLIPSQTRRYQLMLRDPKKFADTDGWTYALFDSEGRLFPEDVETQTKACVACHRIASSRGFVFSQEMFLRPKKNFAHSGAAAESTPLKFSEDSIENLPPVIRTQLKQLGYSKVRFLEGEMRKHLFQGTLDEVRPLLSDESIRSSQPVILLDESMKRFSLVLPDVPKTPCNVFGKKGVILKSMISKLGKDSEVETLHFCHPQS